MCNIGNLFVSTKNIMNITKFLLLIFAIIVSYIDNTVSFMNSTVEKKLIKKFLLDGTYFTLNIFS